jgi:hypothetical protein
MLSEHRFTVAPGGYAGGGVCWALVLSCTLSDRVEAKLNLLMSSATACATCSRLIM